MERNNHSPTLWQRYVASPTLRRLSLLAPGIAAFFVLFVAPISQLLVQGVIDEGSLTIEHFATVFHSDHHVSVLLRTLRIAVVSTVITVVVGYGLAYYIVFHAVRKRLLILLLFVSMLVDLVVRIFGWMIIFSSGGALSTLLQWVGIIDEPFSLLYSELAIVVGIVQFCLPLMVLSVVGVLSGLDRSLVEAAKNLGATDATAFRHVTLPLSIDGIIAGSGLVFALAMSSFVVPQMLGGARNRMLANSVYNVITTSGNTPLAASLSIILLAATLSILVMVESGNKIGGA